MKTSKRLIALLLCLVMSMALMACGGNNKPAESSKAPASEAAKSETPESTAPESTAPSTAPEVKVDLKGRTINVGLWWDYYYESAHTAIEDDPGLSNTETAQLKLDNLRAVEQQFNCKFDFQNLGWDGTIASINNSILAGTPDCDIYFTDLQFGMPAVGSGLAMDLKDVAPADADIWNEKNVFTPLETAALDGVYMWRDSAPYFNAIFLGYNKTMIEELGLEDPQALYKAGNWTWEKFAEYCKTATKDKDGDNVVDVYGFGGVYTDLINGLVLNNGGSIAAGETESLSSPQTLEALNFFNKLYNEDKSARPWDPDDWNGNRDAWVTGKSVFFAGQAWLTREKMQEAANNGTQLEFDFSLVPYPIGPSGDGKYYTPVAGNWYIMAKGIEDAAGVYQAFEALMGWYGSDLTLRDDLSWLYECFLTPEDAELALSLGENVKLDLWAYLGGRYDVGGNVFWPILNNEKTPAQAVEGFKQTVQTGIDSFMKK